MKTIKKLTLIPFLLPALALAGVNLKNGNFYMTYVDVIVVGDGPNLKLSRTYNSKSTYVGWFGYGWGSPFETHITTYPDGSAVIHENGSGAQTRFTLKGAKTDGKAAAQKIVGAMKKKMSLTQAQEQKFLKDFTNDAAARRRYARKFNISASLKPGTTLQSNIRGSQTLQVTANGYKRTYGDGKEEIFDKAGKLRKIKRRDGYTVSINYKKGSDKPHSIKDSEGKQIFVKWNDNGFIGEAWSGKTTKKKAKYTYEGKNLKTTKDVGGNGYVYDWDAFHNMTQIGYDDKSKMTIQYWPKTQYVRNLTMRDGRSIGYTFKSNPKNPKRHYWTLVDRKDPRIKSSRKPDRYEYEIRTRKDGSEYTHRIVTVVGGLRTETTYSECCSLPLSIKRGKKLTTFKYHKGLLKEKISSDGTFVKLDYDEELDKISRVENNNGWTDFQYLKKGKFKGRLDIAKNSQGMLFDLDYDLKGRIDKVNYVHQKSKKKETLTFKYGASGKPDLINMQGVGEIKFAYGDGGTIRNIKSSGGPEVTERVTKTFFSLLAVLKPAGVNLTI